MVLQKHDIFEDMITPRKKDTDKERMSMPENASATKNDAQVDGNDETGAQYWETFKCTHPSSASRKIVTPKVNKLKKQDPVQAEGLNPEDKGATTSKSATSLTLEKRLRRLVFPASNRAKPNSPLLGPPAFVKSSKELTRPSFELPSEERKSIEEVGKQEEEAKQWQLQERFKTHTEKTVAKKDLQQQRPAPAPSRAPTARNPNPVVATVSGPVPLNSRRLTLGEVNQQLSNESELETKEKAEEALLRVRQNAAEKGKESARLWAEQMKAKAEKSCNG